MTPTEQRRIFERWISEHKGLVLKVVRASTATPRDRNDLFQEIAIQLWNSVPSFAGDSKESGWIFRVALNAAAVWPHLPSRAVGRAPSRGGLDEFVEGESGQPHDQLQRLYAELRKLDAIDRSLILMVLEGFNHQEIGDHLGIPASSVPDAVRATRFMPLKPPLPDYPTARLGTCMTTASEVGGDYYDVGVDEGVLTLVVADVTGHGLRAGTMAALAKSLFTRSAREPDLPALVRRSSETLEHLALPDLGIALGVLRLRGHTVEVVGAGLPAALYYRKSERRVATVPLNGLPLGFVLPMDAPYTQSHFTVEPGDVIVLTTDGLVELFNEVEDMFGLERAAAVLAQCADQSPDAIARTLQQAGLAWTSGQPPDDDLTIVVLQFRSAPDPSATLPPSGLPTKTSETNGLSPTR